MSARTATSKNPESAPLQEMHAPLRTVPAAVPDSAVRRVSILGVTGSIGDSALRLLGAGNARFRVEAVTAHRNVKELVLRACALDARTAVIADPACYHELKLALAGTGITPAAGPEALAAAAVDTDTVIAAIVGAAGLPPVMAAVEAGRTVALANKEALVCAGALLTSAAARTGARLLPVDSEHNAVFQALADAPRSAVERIVLTASGGPFRGWTAEQLHGVTPQQAVRHPVWPMGAKISVDSATLMNKGLEVIEAHHLFAMPDALIDVVIHPESVAHGMVAFTDGSVMAHLASPDMQVPLAFALSWPERMATRAPRLDFARLGTLTFSAPDTVTFPALPLARAALREGRDRPLVLNAANEVAVAAFLAGRLPFPAIWATVAETLRRLPAQAVPTLADVLARDAEARRCAEDILTTSPAVSVAAAAGPSVLPLS